MSLTVGSLFSGIGGIDLGLERAGMQVRWQSEIDPYASRVLAKHWPDIPNLGDIKQINWETVEHVDLIAGGYPCQPFSVAGTRTGDDDPRHLWPWFARAISVLRPRWVMLENVRGHLSLGFGQVLGDLACLGYDTDWQVLPAAAFGAPHRRDRVFVVAYPDSDRESGGSVDARETGRLVPDPDSGGRSGRAGTRDLDARRTEPTHDSWWTVEPDVGRVAARVPARMDRLRCLGNAVVPQVAEFVGHRIMERAGG